MSYSFVSGLHGNLEQEFKYKTIEWTVSLQKEWDELKKKIKLRTDLDFILLKFGKPRGA